MDNPYQKLRLNGSLHDRDDLCQLTRQMLQSESVAGWRKKLYLFFEEWLSDDPILEITTSGSTGKPKSLRIHKHRMIRSASRTGDVLGLDSGNRALLCLPVDYIAGKMMVVRAFVLGLDLIPLNPTSDPLSNFKGTAEFAALTPMQVFRTLNRKEGNQQLNGIKTIIVGGADVDEVLEKKLQGLKNTIHHTYGMTETLTHVALRRLTGSDPDPNFKAVPGVFFSTNTEGCLVIHDPALGNDVLETNDLVELIGPTQFRFLGRNDLVINSGGKKLIPEVIEEKIRPHLSHRFVVLGKKDKELGEKVTLVIETRGTEVSEEILERLGNISFEKYEKPREVAFVDFFPESSGGKIKRRDIKV